MIISGAGPSAERGLSALLDLVANPASAAAAKARLAELIKTRDDAQAIVDKAGQVEQQNIAASKDLAAREAVLAAVMAKHQADADVLAAMQAAHAKAVTEHQARVTAVSADLGKRESELVAREAMLASGEKNLLQRSVAIEAREKAADEKTAKADAIIRGAKALVA